MTIARSEGGKIMESRQQEDLLGLMHHQGVSSAPGQLVPWVFLGI
jgi:hypothetical protein